jgi:hypothetical protein
MPGSVTPVEAFVDLSGYAFTGKHAVIDLMREIDGYHVPHFQFEFSLLRIQGGILDLEHALCEDWSPIRSDAAIRRFKRLVRRLGASNRIASPRSWFEAIGWNYDDYYGGAFFELSRRYLDRIVAASWAAPWPYALAECSDGELFVRKLKQKLRWPGAVDFEYHLSRPADFVAATREYLAAVLSSNVGPGTRAVVMHNAFEPYQPARSLKFFERAKAIIVDRDPRDTYVQGLWYAPVATGVREFITRHRIQREATDETPHPDVLRIRFEDLVLDYEGVVSRILEHIGEPSSRHVRKRQHFNPDQSRRNIGIWQGYPKQQEIRQIEQALPEFCDPRSVAVA